MIDAKAIGAELAAAVKTQIDAMAARVADLEKRLEKAEAKPDPVSVKSALIDRAGDLILTLSDGTTKNMGPVVGKDGDPGKDAFGFDDLDVVYDGEKTVTIKFTKGETVKEFPLVMPIVIDRGVYREGNEYKSGDAVTWSGSIWIAQKDTAAKPDTGADWRLSVKRGRDGKDGVVKDAKPVTSMRVGVPSAGE